MAAKIEPFVNFKDRFGRSESLIPLACNWVDNVILTPSNVANYTVPDGAKVLLFGYSGANDVYVNAQQEAIVANANVVNGLGDDINPTGMFIINTTTISFISEGAAVISIRVYGG
jgi:hypothetical protein